MKLVKNSYYLGLALAFLISVGVMSFRSVKAQDEGLSVGDYLKKVNKNEKTVLVYFYADWCVPCIKLRPVMTELEKEESDKIEILKLDVDKNPEVSLHLEINTLPLFIMYKNGKQIWSNNSSMSKQDLSSKINFYK
jgi:thioredoxin